MKGRSFGVIGFILSIGILALTCWHPAIAATVKVVDDERIPIIVISGDFELGDEKRFVDVAVSRPNAIVAFDSGGGNLVAGIEIGKAIRIKGYTTAVLNGSVCASACGLAWLGGQRRLLQPKGLVGFHAAYRNGADGPAVSSIGNAAVGAYLNQIGLSANAIIYVTASEPGQMQWLTPRDAYRHGIDIIDVPNENSSPSTQTPDVSRSEVNWRVQGEWVQAASRSTLSEAIEVAEWIKERNTNTAIFRYRNGWYGVVIGPFPPGRGFAAHTALLEAEDVPPDSLLTRGEAFSSLAWGSPRPRIRP